MRKKRESRGSETPSVSSSSPKKRKMETVRNTVEADASLSASISPLHQQSQEDEKPISALPTQQGVDTTQPASTSALLRQHQEKETEMETSAVVAERSIHSAQATSSPSVDQLESDLKTSSTPARQRVLLRRWERDVSLSVYHRGQSIDLFREAWLSVVYAVQWLWLGMWSSFVRSMLGIGSVELRGSIQVVWQLVHSAANRLWTNRDLVASCRHLVWTWNNFGLKYSGLFMLAKPVDGDLKWHQSRLTFDRLFSVSCWTTTCIGLQMVELQCSRCLRQFTNDWHNFN